MLETIRLNSQGDLVKVAQYLSSFSVMKEADGIYNQEFKDFMYDWQDDHDMANPDGIIGKNTWTKLASCAPTCSTSKNKKSAYTCAVQILIGGLVVDGIYGTNTKKAVVAYQSATKLDADGVCGPKTWNSLICGTAQPNTTPSATPSQTITGNKVINKCVHYLQWDSKWKNVVFTSCGNKSQTIGNSGCGPTSMAQIMATWIDPKITPVEMASLAVKQGYRTVNSGTAWGFFKYIFKKYDGFEKYAETSSVSVLEAAIKEGALAVCSMNSNDNKFWTSGGCKRMASTIKNTVNL